MREGQPYYNGQGDSIEVDIEFDWKARPDEIMKQVHKALKQHGLALESHDTQSDFYAFSIVQRKS